MLEQLVEAVDARREHVAELLHEAVEVRRAALHALLEHLVELAHHVADSRKVLALHLLQRSLDPLEHLVQDLLLQLLHQLFELLARGVVDELVVAQAFDTPAQVIGQPVELLLALPRDPVEQLFRLRRGFVEATLDAPALGVDHVLHLLSQLLDGRVEVVATQLALTRLAELFQELLETGHVRRAPPQEPLQGGVQVAVVHQVVGQSVEDVARIEIVEFLGSVPPRVAELHPITLAGRQPPRARSMARAARSATRSFQLRATTWTPIGMFSGEVPARTTTQGLPVRL